MDNFIVSARKYRPQNFNTVVGQEAITTTLRNSILKQQIGQAFLFCGPRGYQHTKSLYISDSPRKISTTPLSPIC